MHCLQQERHANKENAHRYSCPRRRHDCSPSSHSHPFAYLFSVTRYVLGASWTKLSLIRWASSLSSLPANSPPCSGSLPALIPCSCSDADFLNSPVAHPWLLSTLFLEALSSSKFVSLDNGTQIRCREHQHLRSQKYSIRQCRARARPRSLLQRPGRARRSCENRLHRERSARYAPNGEKTRISKELPLHHHCGFYIVCDGSMCLSRP